MKVSLPLSLVVLALACGSLTGLTLPVCPSILEKVACVALALVFACLVYMTTKGESEEEDQEEDNSIIV